MGMPAVFLRLGGCNLRCAWCDTKYTWDWSQYDRAKETSKQTIEDVARGVASEGPGRLVVTGGEPMLQQNGLVALAAALEALGAARTWEVETAGTIAPTPAMRRVVAQWNVSPKLSGSGNDPERAVRPDVLRAFAALDHAWFKFVVGDEDEADEAMALAAAHGVRADRVLLMPQATDAEAYRARAPAVVDWALSRGVGFSPRAHVAIWGGRRGV